MPKRRVFIFTLITMLSSFYLTADASITATLDEAEDYLTVNPAQTLLLLDSITKPAALAPELFIRHQVLVLRAAVPTNKMDRLIRALDDIFEHHQHPYFKEQLTPITSALGIWLRRNNYLNEAISSLECSYKHASTDRQRLTLGNSMALVARQLNETEKARLLFTRARLLAEQTGQIKILAMTENNLGLLALEQANIALAESHFRTALGHYQSSSVRAGQISAGINLLFTFLVQDDLTSFQRLYSPTAALTLSFPNKEKQALLFWLHTRFEQLQQQPVSDQIRQQLLDSYQQIEDAKVQILLHRYMATPLQVNISIAEPAARPIFDRPWFGNVVQCVWPLPEA
ncbi:MULTISPECIES: tetratricopeptide repeat protein [unclassified Arsukibacterium]|uniref:tetratricopeptide repeat protein n=1 Tax=unclassified Arsukibacterium TaxID=2635278 RepID=UPI0025B7F81D|nr:MULTISPECIES: tetratricopeptide repeat protein [unclassified Arsukibacterium]